MPDKNHQYTSPYSRVWCFSMIIAQFLQLLSFIPDSSKNCCHPYKKKKIIHFYHDVSHFSGQYHAYFITFHANYVKTINGKPIKLCKTSLASTTGLYLYRHCQTTCFSTFYCNSLHLVTDILSGCIDLGCCYITK